MRFAALATKPGEISGLARSCDLDHVRIRYIMAVGQNFGAGALQTMRRAVLVTALFLMVGLIGSATAAMGVALIVLKIATDIGR